MNRTIYVLKRLALGVPVLIFGLTMSFLIITFAPIDPVLSILGQDAKPTDIKRLEIALNIRYADGGLVPLWDRYLMTMTDLLTLDFGQSWVVQTNVPTMKLIANRLPATLWLGFWSVLIALFVGIPVGLYAGLRSNTWGDYIASAGGIIWRAMPNFWLAVMLSGLLTAGGALSWFRTLPPKTDVVGTSPALGQLASGFAPFAGLPYVEILWVPIPNLGPMLEAFKWILPAALVLGSASMGNEVRIGRTAVLESINSKYIDTAKAKGLRNRTIIGKHVGRNAMIPLLPVIMGEFYLLIGGSVIVESVFSINGLGNLFLSAIFAPDIPVLMALIFIFIIIQIMFNITQDLLYTFIDPRITLSDRNG
ncbi:MAG: ABC transporter permease [Haloarculaceae archaeon]